METTLAHINVPPAQTWNYLRINEMPLEVATPHGKGGVLSRLPRLFDDVECGIGPEAIRWVEASAGDARYVEVPRATVREEPIVISVNSNAGEAEDVGVMLREGAEATVVVAVRSEQGSAPAGAAEAPTTSAAVVRVICERGSKLSVVEVVAGADNGQHLEGVGIKAADGVTIEARQYALGGSKVALGFAADLVGKGARLGLETRYVARGDEKLDVNHVVRQRGCDTDCNIHAQGLLADAAQKTMRETIDLVHGAKGSRGNEAETVLVTGDRVVNKTLPVILCDEDDVAGNHGASIGSVSPEQLAYLSDRGLSEGEAQALFARAIFDDAVIHAPERKSLSAALNRGGQVLGEETGRDLAEALELGSYEDASASDSKGDASC